MKQTAIYITIYLFSLFALRYVFSVINKSHKKIYLMFLSTVFQTILTIGFLFKILYQFDAFKSLAKTILLSSSLLIAVVGFAFQRSLEDIIAGFMISFYRPFEIGDRINITEKNISGYIENITIRHTIIKTFMNSRLIIPNSVMNREILENANMTNPMSSGFVDFSVDRYTDIALAEKIIKSAIINEKESINFDGINEKPSPSIYVNSVTDNAINLRASVWTKSIEENFTACSNIRKTVLKEFQKNNIESPIVYIKQ